MDNDKTFFICLTGGAAIFIGLFYIGHEAGIKKERTRGEQRIIQQTLEGITARLEVLEQKGGGIVTFPEPVPFVYPEGYYHESETAPSGILAPPVDAVTPATPSTGNSAGVSTGNSIGTNTGTTTGDYSADEWLQKQGDGQ